MSGRFITAALSAAFLAISSISAIAPAQAQQPAEPPGQALRPERIPNQYIVVFRDDVQDPRGLARALAAANGFQLRHVYGSALKGFSATMPPGLAQVLAGDPDVVSVEQDLVAHAVTQSLPTGIQRIDVPGNSIAAIGGSASNVNADVAVIDTGIAWAWQGSELNIAGGVDFVGGGGSCSFSSTGSPGDDISTSGHGTHVSGTIAAIDNQMGVVGVAPGARLWAVRVLDANGSGAFSDVIAGIDCVTAHADTIEVANMSLSGIGSLDALRQAIQESVAKGVVYVVAAGNEARDIYGSDGIVNDESNAPNESMRCYLFGSGCKGDSIPAAYPEVMTVSALADSDGQPGGQGPNTSYGADDTLATFSNYSANVDADNPVTSQGAAIDVAAPGVSILSLANDGTGLAIMSGTSMASPHVAGAVALYIAANDRATDANGVYAIRQAVIDHAEGNLDFPSADPDNNDEAVVNAADASVGGPTANDDPATTDEDTPVTIAVLGNDIPETSGAALSVTSTSTPAHGTAVVNTDDTVTYTPSLNFNGVDSFLYTMSETGGGSDSAAVTVTVNPVNDAPVANDDPDVSTQVDTPVDIDVLANDTDPDGDSLTISSYTSPAHGGLISSGDLLTYSPEPEYSGSDSFTYTVQDPSGAGSNSATVTILVTKAAAITLSTRPYKVKGVQHVDLTWSGAASTNVDIYRDGSVVATTANDGFENNNINQKGGGVTYTYQVCEAGTSTCSDPVPAAF